MCLVLISGSDWLWQRVLNGPTGIYWAWSTAKKKLIKSKSSKCIYCPSTPRDWGKWQQLPSGIWWGKIKLSCGNFLTLPPQTTAQFLLSSSFSGWIWLFIHLKVGLFEIGFYTVYSLWATCWREQGKQKCNLAFKMEILLQTALQVLRAPWSRMRWESQRLGCCLFIKSISVT